MRTSKIQNGRQGAQNDRRGLERGLPLDFGALRQLLQNKVFDSSNTSMRKVEDWEKNRGENNDRNNGP